MALLLLEGLPQVAATITQPEEHFLEAEVEAHFHHGDDESVLFKMI